MELRTFVSETLTQIVEGVSDAQKRIADMNVGAAVNPDRVDSAAKRKIGKESPVEFDVAVLVSEERTEQEGSAVKASLGIIAVVSAKTAAELDSRTGGGQRNEITSRIKFTVQLAQPSDLEEYTMPRNPASGGSWMNR